MKSKLYYMREHTWSLEYGLSSDRKGRAPTVDPHLFIRCSSLLSTQQFRRDVMRGGKNE